MYLYVCVRVWYIEIVFFFFVIKMVFFLSLEMTLKTKRQTIISESKTHTHTRTHAYTNVQAAMKRRKSNDNYKKKKNERKRRKFQSIWERIEVHVDLCFSLYRYDQEKENFFLKKKPKEEYACFVNIDISNHYFDQFHPSLLYRWLCVKRIVA